MRSYEFEDEISALYDRVSRVWDEHKERILDGKCGYSVFGSRPYPNPELMIIGLNPGFGGDENTGPDIDKAPTDASYLENDHYRLKAELTKLFEFEGGREILDGAVATNFLFFRSSDIGSSGPLSWNTVAESTRRQLEEFSLQELERIIELIQPKRLLIVGLEAVDRHVGEAWVRLYRGSDQFHRLIVSGTFADKPVLGVKHLTGGHFSTYDKDLMSLWFRQYFEKASR